MLAKLTIFQVNDLHAQVWPHHEYFWEGGLGNYRADIGGMARIAGIVKRARREAPGQVLFFDCGDALFGSYYGHLEEGAGLVRVLNDMSLDATNAGHWEFSFGPQTYLERVRALNYPVYACNVHDKATGQLVFRPYGVHEADGVRVGVIGLASNIVDKSMPPAFSEGLFFTMGLEKGELAAAVAALAEQADIIVALSHLGLGQDIEVAKRAPGIDVFISGHTHNRLYEPYVLPAGEKAAVQRAATSETTLTSSGSSTDVPNYGPTIFVESGFSGSFLGRLDLTVDLPAAGGRPGSRGRARITDYQWRLQVVDTSLPEDEETRAAAEKLTRPHREVLAEVIGRTETPLNRMLFLESTMDNLITQAYQEYTGAEVAVSHGWRFGPPIPAGDITLGDLWNMLPLDVPVFTLRLTGRELRDLIEKWMADSATAPINQKGGYFTRQSGMNVVARINNPDGYRVEELFIDGRPWRADSLYSVAVGGQQDIGANVGRDRQRVGTAQAIVRRYLVKGPARAELTHDKFIWA